MSVATRYSNEDGGSLLAALFGALAVIPNLFYHVSRANSAAQAFERLNHLSNTELAARGLKREELGKYICETYLDD